MLRESLTGVVVASALAALVGCEEAPMIQDEGLALGGKHPGACVQEQKDSAGTVVLRVLRNWQEELLVREEQEVLGESNDPWAWYEPYITEWSHDGEGRIVSRRHDTGADGTIDDKDSFEYDAAGRKVREGRESPWGADKTLWAFDANGNLLREEWYDHMGNSRLDRKTYGPHGRVTTEETLGNGLLESITTWSYDGNGNPLSKIMEQQPNMWSTGQRHETLFIYTAGKLVTTTLRVDYDKDGNWNRTEVTSHDDAGRALATQVDDDANGVIDRVLSWEYDAAGRTVRERETNGDGTLRYSDVMWAFDDAGRLKKTIWYPSQWQTEKRIEIRTWGAHGLVELSEQSGTTVVRREAWTYDSLGNQTSHSIDWNGNGVPDFTETAGFDADGNRLWSEEDNDGDGTLDVRLDFEYGCFE